MIYIPARNNYKCKYDKFCVLLMIRIPTKIGDMETKEMYGIIKE